MGQDVHQVETGTMEAEKSGRALQNILAQVHDVAMQITGVMQQTSQGAHESATAAAQLSGSAEELQHLVRQFKL